MSTVDIIACRTIDNREFMVCQQFASCKRIDTTTGSHRLFKFPENVLKSMANERSFYSGHGSRQEKSSFFPDRVILPLIFFFPTLKTKRTEYSVLRANLALNNTYNGPIRGSQSSGLRSSAKKVTITQII